MALDYRSNALVSSPGFLASVYTIFSENAEFASKHVTRNWNDGYISKKERK